MLPAAVIPGKIRMLIIHALPGYVLGVILAIIYGVKFFLWIVISRPKIF